MSLGTILIIILIIFLLGGFSRPVRRLWLWAWAIPAWGSVGVILVVLLDPGAARQALNHAKPLKLLGFISRIRLPMRGFIMSSDRPVRGRISVKQAYIRGSLK